MKVAERSSLTRCRTLEIMRARQATRTAQQGCSAVAAGQLDTEDEPGGGRSQPLFLGCQTLTGALGLARPAALRSAGLHVDPEPSSVSQRVYADAETGSQTGPQ